MSADFRCRLIKDSRLADITDSLDYAVMSGASSSTFQQFNAITSSSSSIVYNVQIPSEAIVVSREVLIQSQLTLRIHITDVPVGETAFNYGKTDAFQAFPLNSLFTTISSTINNTNVSCNLQDVKDALLRLNKSRELCKYNGFTPTLPDDHWYNYYQGDDTLSNPLGSYSGSLIDVNELPRGAHPLDDITIIHKGLEDDEDDSLVSQSLDDTWDITITATFTEPLLGLSPFIFGEPEYNCQGLAGINVMNFVMNIDGACKRVFSTSSSAGTYTVSLPPNPFTNPRLLLNFLSTQASDLIPSRNVVPYMDFPRYLSMSANGQPFQSEQSGTLNSQNIQLNQLPDYFIVFVRKPMSQQGARDSSSFWKIKGVSINLSNQSGLLSSATPQDLWRISVANGSHQSWIEFSGDANCNVNETGKGTTISTTGSLLILSPARDLSLPDYCSSGSIGQFSIQMSIQVQAPRFYRDNYTEVPEIVIIPVLSGIFVSCMGQSNIYTGILTKQMVLDAKEKNSDSPVSSSEYRRMVGGKLHHHGMSMIKKFPFTKHSSGGSFSGGASTSGGAGIPSKLSKYY